MVARRLLAVLLTLFAILGVACAVFSGGYLLLAFALQDAQGGRPLGYVACASWVLLVIVAILLIGTTASVVLEQADQDPPSRDGESPNQQELYGDLPSEASHQGRGGPDEP